MMPQRICLLIAGAVAACTPMHVQADSVTFTGSSIALKNIAIQSLQGGKLNYTDAGGQRQSRSLDDVQTLGFDRFAELDQAEQELADGKIDAGFRDLLRAMLAADSDLEKLWVHARLARVHDLRKEYVQAASHAAAVMLLTADAYWRSLEPVCTPRQAAYPAVKEAYDNLQAAKAKVKVSELSNSLARMFKVIQPLYEAMTKDYKGSPIAPGSTISGFARGEILGDGLESPAQNPAPETTTVKTSRPPAPQPPTSTPGTSVKANELTSADADGRSAGSLDAMLAANRWAESLEACKQIEKDPGNRDLGHFLFQYGSALKNNGQSRDAAVMFLRSAVLFPDGSDAAECLIQCAEIHRVEMNNPQIARRLLERAIALAGSIDQPEAAAKAREALQSLATSATAKEP